MNCPKCKSERLVKDGIIQTRQRYLCKDCDYRHTVVCKSSGKSSEVKRMALMMYLEGLGFNSIARILKVSHVAVLKWIRTYGQQLAPLRGHKAIEIVELDEVHTYIGSKKTIAGYGLLLIEMGESMWTSFWVTAARKLANNSGKESKSTAKGK